MLTQLERLADGRLELIDGAERRVHGDPGADAALTTTVRVENPAFYTDVILGGSIGAAESYMRGHWSCPDLTTLVRLLIRNESVLQNLDSRWKRVMFPIHRVLHALKRNTHAGSRKNIQAHYDLSNEFFALFLDETMTYSCGVFETEATTLAEASLAKIDRICRKLALRPGDRLLEIGTGWGALAIHAAREYGCHVTTTTISSRQHDLARQRFDEAGLGDRIRLLREDYRNLSGRYDKIVSVEMIEAVGHQYYDTYFWKCSELLEPDGQLLIQAITMSESRYEEQLRSADFIKRYIFPGSCLPSVGALMNSIGRVTDLDLFHLEDLTPHYVRTLREWRRRFMDALDTVRSMGYSEEFIRMWEYYLAYCEGAFAESYIGDIQLHFAKPRFERPKLYPLLAQGQA